MAPTDEATAHRDTDAGALSRAPVRVVLWGGIVGVCLAVFGHIMGTRIGGFGPSLFWVGLLAAALAFAVGAVLARLDEARIRNLQPLFHATAVVCQVGVLALAMLEVVSRFDYPGKEPLWAQTNTLGRWQRPHLQLGWAPAKSYEAFVEFDTRRIRLQLDSNGFRDIEQVLDPDRPRVVIIGDSYPVGWGSEYEDSIAPRLREVLPEVQVFNASWVGYAKDQIALSYSIRARTLHPDVVIVMFMVEPGVDDSLPLYAGLRKPWFVLRDGKLQMKGLPIEFVTTPASNKTLYRVWEADRITGPLAALRFLTREFPRQHLALGQRTYPDYDWVEINRQGLPPLSELESAILADLKLQIEADGAKMIVALAPPPAVYRHCRDPVAAMETYLDSYRAIGIEPLDITPYVLDNWRSHYNEESHPNRLGVDAIRHALAERVRRALQSK